jgi:adenylate kinase family enzyme
MDRVLVIGCSAGGKSTVARRIGETLGIEVTHLDKVMWKPGCKLTRPEEEHGEIVDLLDRPRWVIDGNYTASLPMRLAKCDTIVMVDYPRSVCLMRALKRLVTHFGTTRPTMGEACPETVNLSLLKWIWEYPEKERPELMRQLRLHGSHAEVVILRNQRETDRFLNRLRSEHGQRKEHVGLR